MYSTLLFGLALSVSAPAAKESPKKEAPSILGEWVGKKTVRGGKEASVPEGGVILTFTADGKLMVKEGRRENPKAESYTVDTKKSPLEIDLPHSSGKSSILGIYKIDGDTLTLRLLGAKDGEGSPGRPSKFESPEGSFAMLMTFKRVKK